MKKCSTCGSPGPFSKDKTRKCGYAYQCKSCKNEWRRNYIKTPKGKKWQREYRHGLTNKYHILLSNAKRRLLKVELTLKQYKEKVLNASCFYCKGKLPEFGSGIDRVNSKLSYTVKNTVPCCIECQQAKNDRSSKEFFLHTKSLSESEWFKKCIKLYQ